MIRFRAPAWLAGDVDRLIDWPLTAAVLVLIRLGRLGHRIWR